MDDNIICIVGNKFANFCANENVYTFNQFINLAYNQKISLYLDKLIVGQGLNPEEKKILYLIANNNNITTIAPEERPAARNQITHKFKEKNVIITEPELLNSKEKTYLSYLCIDDDCADLDDHVTGQHIQGMVQTEASRQMMLAVAEKYLLHDEHKNNFYCILQRLSSEFHQFCFPITTKIIHKITFFDNSKPNRYQVKTTTDFFQNNKTVSTVEIDYFFSNRAMLLEIESKMARLALSKIKNTEKEIATTIA